MLLARWVLGMSVLGLSLLALPGHSLAAPVPIPVAPVTPECSTAVATAPSVAVQPHFTDVAGQPFDVATTADGRFTFVSSDAAGQPDGGIGGAILVFARDGQGAALRSVPLGNAAPAGMAFAEHGRILLVAADSELVVLDVAAAERGTSGAVVAEVPAFGGGAIEVAPSSDARDAFVTVENDRRVDVFRLKGTGRPDYVGAVTVGDAPVGMALSPDGRTLYVTSEAASVDAGSLGTLSLINVARAERDPAASVERTITAGCSPVRVVVSQTGTVVWVTARGSDAVLGFSAAALVAGRPAQVADVPVGSAPVGLAFVDAGRLVVADSNRFGNGTSSSLAVVDTDLAVAGQRALLGYVPAGAFPRQMFLEPGGAELDVTNYQSGQLEVVPVGPLAAANP